MSTQFTAWEANPHSSNKGITVEEELALVGINPGNIRLVTDDGKDGLDGTATTARYRRNRNRYDMEKELQHSAREERLTDHDFYDGDQWDPDDEAELEERGQDALVFNRVKPTCDWITGTEKRTRIDYRVLPRTADDSKGAEVKTKLLKYVGDVAKIGWHRSRAFNDAIRSGLGWLEVGIKSDPDDEPLFVRYEDWRNILHDSLSQMPDYSDARYIFRTKWVDLDIACAMFPDRVAQILLAANDYTLDAGDDILDLDEEILENIQGRIASTDSEFHERNRVKLVECWYKEPMKCKLIRGKNLGTLNNMDFDDTNPYMCQMVEEGYATTHDAIKMRVRQMVWAGNHVLQDQESPYVHNRFPFVPIWAYRKFRTNDPYGVVRNIRDPQYDLNKRKSKALHILSTNKIIADSDATNDWNRLYDEAQQPDGLIRKKSGSEVSIINEIEIGQVHMQLMADDMQHIEATGGVTDENRGQETNATSGKAIRARQEQGHVITAELFDNLKLAVQICGEIMLSLIEQYYTDFKTVRLTGDKGQMEFEEINVEDPETGEILNDITQSQADFTVDTQDWNATVRQSMFESMGDLLSKMDTEVAMMMLDLWVDLADIPGKDEMVRRIREVNGQRDPDEDENDPEAQAERKAEEAQKAFEAEMQQRMAQAEVEAAELENAETRAKIQETLAKVRKTMADAAAAGAKPTIEKAKVLAQIEQAEQQLVMQAATDANANRQKDEDRAASERQSMRQQAQPAGANQ